MKKTGNGKGKNTSLVRPGVRSLDSSSGSSFVDSKSKPSKAKKSGTSTRSSSSTTSKRSSGAKKSGAKKANKKAPVFAVVIAVVVLGVAAGVLYKMGYFEKRYDIKMADGSVVKMTQAELVADMTKDVFPQGIIINGVDVSGMTRDEALAAVQANQPERPIDIDVKLSLDGTEYPLDLSTLPIDTNDVEIVDTAFAYLRPTGQESVEELIALHDSREALKSAPATYQTAYTLNTDDISPLVHNVLDPLNNEAVEAEITGFDPEELVFEYTDSEMGYVVDIDTAVADVKALLDSGTYIGTVPVNAEITEPTLTSEMIENEFGLISSSSSTTSPNENRDHNIEITADKLDGHVIPAGESFSFNGYIGQRTADAGYREAGVIVDGAIEQALGGGVCQVSSMIYQSALKADLSITERHPHQWPSSYAVAGTDAAVDWPAQDFAFTNDSDYPIAFHAYLDRSSSPCTLVVEIYGHQFPDGQYIELEAETVSSSTAGVTYQQNTSMPVGQTNTVRTAHNGCSADCWQVWYDADGNEIDRVIVEPRSVYPTINQIVEVGTLQPDGSQAQFDGSTGSITTSETTTEATEATTEETTTQPAETTPAPTETTPAPTETTPAPTETNPPPPESSADGSGEQPA